MIWESVQFYLQAYEIDELQKGNPMSEYCTSCGVAWENHFGLAYTCRSLSEAAEERDEYKARLNTATETIKRLEAEIAEWRLASGVEGPLFLKHETAGNPVRSHSHS